MLRIRAFPKWLAWIAIVLGVLAVTPAGFFVFLAYGIWVLLTSIVMLRSPETTSPAA